MKIYVLVEVTYDYFRFQKNLWASTDQLAVERYAHSLIYDIHNKRVGKKAPMWKLEYYDRSLIGGKTDFNHKHGVSHLWIDVFEGDRTI